MTAYNIQDRVGRPALDADIPVHLTRTGFGVPIAIALDAGVTA
jgi:hypothetical protein